MPIRQSAQGFLRLDGGTLTGGLVVALGTITADQQNISSTATWNNAGVTFTALKLNITDTASNSSSLLIDLQVAGSSMFKVDKAGGLTAGASITSTGSVRSVDGRFSQPSGPVIDLRTANTVKLFQSDGSTPASLVSGSIAVAAGTIQYGGLATGLVNVMAATIAPAITAYTTGAFYIVQANITNTTTTPTLNLNGLGAKTIVKRAATALAAGDYVANMMCIFVYDGTNMELINPVVN